MCAVSSIFEQENLQKYDDEAMVATAEKIINLYSICGSEIKCHLACEAEPTHLICHRNDIRHNTMHTDFADTIEPSKRNLFFAQHVFRREKVNENLHCVRCRIHRRRIFADINLQAVWVAPK